jgi:hypothetical protein
MATAPTLGGMLTPTPEAKPPSRFGSFTQALMVGGGLAGGGSVAIAAIELIHSEPERAFKLLHDWGPWGFLSMLIAYVVGSIGKRGLDVFETFSTRVANSLESQAVAMSAQAVALQKSADKDDRNLQEIQTLTSLTAQRSEKTYAMMQAFHEDNQQIAKLHGETLKRIEEKVDARLAGAEKSQQ